MKNLNGNYETLENLSNTERLVRVLVSTGAIVAAMESSIAGSSLFAAITFIGIALAMTGVIGWDPVRAMSHKTSKAKTHVSSHHDHHGHAA